MRFSKGTAAIALSLFTTSVQAAPATIPSLTLETRGFGCSSPVFGLSQADCTHISSLNFKSQGINTKYNNGIMWLGNDGPNKFTFTNKASDGQAVTLVMWRYVPQDYLTLWMTAYSPQVTYSLAPHASVTVSVANGISGGFAALYGQRTGLNGYGMIDNTWGEFTSGQDATINISREVSAFGRPMSITTSGGCTSDFGRCVFQCKDKSRSFCGDGNTYELLNCENGSQPGANIGWKDWGWGPQPEGGCKGWSNGGTVTTTFL